jgi:hypothetical protein
MEVSLQLQNEMMVREEYEEELERESRHGDINKEPFSQGPQIVDSDPRQAPR